jgi:hypothetical protein
MTEHTPNQDASRLLHLWAQASRNGAPREQLTRMLKDLRLPSTQTGDVTSECLETHSPVMHWPPPRCVLEPIQERQPVRGNGNIRAFLVLLACVAGVLFLMGRF